MMVLPLSASQKQSTCRGRIHPPRSFGNPQLYSNLPWSYGRPFGSLRSSWPPGKQAERLEQAKCWLCYQDSPSKLPRLGCTANTARFLPMYCSTWTIRFKRFFRRFGSKTGSTEGAGRYSCLATRYVRFAASRRYGGGLTRRTSFRVCARMVSLLGTPRRCSNRITTQAPLVSSSATAWDALPASTTAYPGASRCSLSSAHLYRWSPRGLATSARSLSLVKCDQHNGQILLSQR
jgi:hypothetical protein